MQRGDLPNVYFPFISIKLKDGTHLSWNGNAPDYFTSLTNTRYINQANTAKISITVAVGPDDDPSKIEKVIVESGGECIYQYGLAGRKSKVYQGLITGYIPHFSEGLISYDLNIVSKAVTFNGVKITGLKYSIPDSVRQRLVSGSGSSGSLVGILPDIVGPTIAEIYAKSIVLTVMDNIVERYMPGYTFDVENSDIDFEPPTVDVDCEGKNPVQAMKDIVKILYKKGSEHLYFYKVVVDDSIGDSGLEGTVKIKKMGGSPQDADLKYEFVWGSRDCDVLSWSPQYQGTALIFRNTKNTAEIASTVQIDGQTVEFSAFDQPPISNFTDDLDRWKGNWNDTKTYRRTLEDTAWYCEQCNYPYRAELTVLGVPDDDIQLFKFVRVLPLVGGGYAHHSMGVYQIIGIKDSISSQGFTTQLSLVKMVEESKLYIASERQFVYDKDGNKTNLYEYVPNVTKGTADWSTATQSPVAATNYSVYGSGSASTIIPGNEYENATVVWNTLAEAGYSDVCCAGILGNLMKESGGNTLNIDPTAHYQTQYEDSWGIAQWNRMADDNGTYQSLIYGNPDIKAQADFLVRTIPMVLGWGRLTISEFKSASTPEAAATLFNKYYEISSDPEPYTERMNNARLAYEWYSSLRSNSQYRGLNVRREVK